MSRFIVQRMDSHMKCMRLRQAQVMLASVHSRLLFLCSDSPPERGVRAVPPEIYIKKFLEAVCRDAKAKLSRAALRRAASSSQHSPSDLPRTGRQQLEPGQRSPSRGTARNEP